MLTPEPPYPLNGGGAFRTASLVHYFARFAAVDLILFSESGQPALLPPGLVRSQTVIPLPAHGKGTLERYLRNARRAIQGIPPLVDRLGGLDKEIVKLIEGKRWDLGIVEHFWCAPYIETVKNVCGRTILDLHNVESLLNERCAAASRNLIAVGHRRFASMSRQLESRLLPLYSLVLTTSETDAEFARGIAPGVRARTYPNALPGRERPAVPEENCLVFSANFEYHPNIDAVAFLLSEIWPKVRREHPDVGLRLVGRGDESVRRLFEASEGVESTGPVDDAFGEIARARIVVAPLRAGSGTRIKILEAWAAGKAVVATPLAAEGLAAESGGNLLLADNAADFAAAISMLLKDANQRQRLGNRGRQTFERLYTWERAWEGLDRDLQVAWPVELNGFTAGSYPV
jgi:glycosyltransferase involved in cell wall biosynthesis